MAGAAALPSEFGRYQIRRKLGQGGMGTVYLAFDTQLDREVALKVPSLGEDAQATVVDRFMREARLAAKLVHPNLCPIFDVGSHDGTPYLTMPFLKGQTIAQLLRASGAIPGKQAAAFVQRIALAMHEAHKHGIIHRDLKPANIMIDERKQPIVMDFGLAREARGQGDRLTKSGGVVGTPVYMAPEQIDADPAALGPACDIYSLGMVFYEMLTGTVPFEGPLTVLIGQIVMLQPRPPSALRPGLETTWDAVCLRALAKAPSDRYPTMLEFAKALGFTGKPTSASGSTPVLPPPTAPSVAAMTATVAGAALETALPAHERRTMITRMVKPRVAKPTRGISPLALGGLLALILFTFLLAAAYWALPRPTPTESLAHMEPAVSRRPPAPASPPPSETPTGPEPTRRGGPTAPEQPARAEPQRPSQEPEPREPWVGHRTQPRCAAITPDQRWLVTGGDEGDFGVYLWDGTSGQLVHRFDGHTEIVRAVDISADGRWAITGGGGRFIAGQVSAQVMDSQVRLWNLTERRLERDLGAHGAIVHAVALSPNGVFAASAGERFSVANTTATLAFWNLPRQQRFAVPATGCLARSVRTLAFTPDSKWLVVGGADGVGLIDTQSWIPQREWVPDEPQVSALAVDANGERIAVGTTSGMVSVWDFKGRRLASLPRHERFVGSVAFFPDGRRLLSIGADRSIRIHDLTTQKVLDTQTSEHHLQGGILAPDGRRAFTFGHHPTLKLWTMPDPPPPAPLAKNDQATDPPAKPKRFMPMIVGSTLNTWEIDGSDPTAFSLEDGALVCQAKAMPRGAAPKESWLLTKAEYGDFIIRGQVSILAGADSGFCFRTQKGMPDGNRAEVNFVDEAFFRQTMHPGLRFGSFWNERWIDRPTRIRGYGRWNDFQIELRGDHLKVTINGQATIDGDLAARANGQRRTWLNVRRGKLGFQALYGVARYCNLEISDLDPGAR